MLSPIPLDTIFALLPSDLKRQSSKDWLEELDSSKKHESARKRFYKLKIKESEAIHLTYGQELDRVFKNTACFHDVLPDYTCKPLFLKKSGEYSLFAQEFFEGHAIDILFKNSKLNENDVTKILTKIHNIFQDLEKPSSKELAKQEFNDFFKNVLHNNLFADVDKQILQTEIKPKILNWIEKMNPTIRWSQGDLAARNILVNENKEFKIIDCEFASRTHYHQEEWLRIKKFSSGKFGNNSFLQSKLHNLDKKYNILLHLKQIKLNKLVLSKNDYILSTINDFWECILELSNDKETKSFFFKGLISSKYDNDNTIQSLKQTNHLFEKDLFLERQNRVLLEIEMKNLYSRNKQLNEEHDLINKEFKTLHSNNEKMHQQKEKMNKELETLHSNNEKMLQQKKEMRKELKTLHYKSEIMHQQFEDKVDKIQRMEHSFSWKCTRILRFLRRQSFDKIKLKKFQLSNDVQYENTTLSYENWVKTFDQLEKSELLELRNEAKRFKYSPLISIIMPIFNPQPEFLEAAIQSVLNQTYNNWELCIADDASTISEVQPLLRKYSDLDKRVKVTFCKQHGHISVCSNIAAKAASGQFIAFADHDDVIRPHALHYIAKVINDNPSASLIYTDEDKIDDQGIRFSPFFKPDWNPDLLKSQNYLCHLSVVKSSIFNSIGGFRKGYEGSQDWDLMLRVTEIIPAHEIIHIPRILYHWRATSSSTAKSGCNKSYALKSAKKGLNEHHKRQNLGAFSSLQKTGYFKTQFPNNCSDLCTVVIPTFNGGKVLKRSIESIYSLTKDIKFELLVIDNGSSCELTLDLLHHFESSKQNFKTLRDISPFNYSALNNRAVKSLPQESVLVFLNDDTEILEKTWLSELVVNANRPDIGAVGGKLLYPNGKIQHAGVILGIGGVAGHAFRNLDEDFDGHMNRANIAHNVSAVTGACMAVKKEKFDLVNGFDEQDLPIAFNDVDLCLKLMARGYRNLFLPQVKLIHHESYSRGADDTPEKSTRFKKESETMQMRWGDLLLNDPSYNPNLSLFTEQFDLSHAPRL